MYNWITRQPIAPAQLSNCNQCDTDCDKGHLIDFTDTVDVQINIFPCEGATPLAFGGGSPVTWILGGGSICGNGAGSYLAGYGNPTYARYFQIEFEVSSLSSGSITLDIGGEGFVIIAPGSYVFYSTAPPAGSVMFNVVGDFVGCFSAVVEITPIPTEYKMVLYNSDNVGVATFTDVELSDTGNWLTFHNDISALDIEPGCYSFGLLDPCVNTCFQNFLPGQNFEQTGVNVNHWSNLTSPDEWEVLIQGKAEIEVATNGGFIYINDSELCIGSYEVSILITALESPNTFSIILGGNTLTATEPGTLTGILTVTSEAGLANNILFNGTFADAAGGFISVEQFTFNRIASEAVADEDSISYSIGNYIGQKCILNLEGCCTGEALGFDFSIFNPIMRIHGAVQGPQYVIDGEIIRGNSGKTNVPFWDVVKEKDMAVEAVPEYVHDFLSIWIGFDFPYVNGFAIAPNEAKYPALDWSETCTAPVVLPLRGKNQKARKVQCDLAVECLPRLNSVTGKQFQDGDYFVFQDGKLYLFQ